MIVVNLEKYAEEYYYKQPANSPSADSPDNITHARLYYGTFAGNDYLQGDFVSDNNSTVEFDNSSLGDALFKLFVSTDGTTYTELKTYGGTTGRDEFSAGMVLDPADYEDYEIPTKVTVTGVEQFLPKTLTEIVEAGTLSMNDYYFVRGRLIQDNSVYSGRPFFGSIAVNVDTGALVGSSQSYYTNAASNLVNTISNYIYRTGSAKVTTGVYYLQSTVGSTGPTAVNGFITALDGTSFKYKFESSVFPVYGSRTITGSHTNELTISHIQRASATRIRIKITGVSTGNYSEYAGEVGNQWTIDNLVSDISPLPDGLYTITAVDSVSVGYIEFDCNSASGTGTMVAATGSVYLTDDTILYGETYVPGLVGYVVLDVEDNPLTYYGTGKLLIKTYNTSWVLTDNILSYGCTLTFKAYKVG